MDKDKIARADFPLGISSQNEYYAFLEDLKKCLSHPAGQSVIIKIMEECSIFSTTTNFSNQMQAFKEGARNIGLHILHAIMDSGSFVSFMQSYWNKTSDKK